MDQKAYYFDQMDEGASAHSTHVARVQALTEELRGRMNALAQIWQSSGASPAQQAAHQAWNSVTEDVNQIAQRRGTAVTNARERMAATEQRNATLFT